MIKKIALSLVVSIGLWLAASSPQAQFFNPIFIPNSSNCPGLAVSHAVTLTSGTSWNVPANYCSITSASTVAGGASGAAARSGSNSSAPGGGAGAYSTSTGATLSGLVLTGGVSTVTYKIGAGGLAVSVSGNSVQNGNAGGDTVFG